MAAQTDARPAGMTDRDLASIQEARELARRARQAQVLLAELSQQRIDAIVDAMAAAVTPQAETLARLAVEETGFGVVADKVQKNLFASERVHEFIRPMRTVGVINRLEDRKVVEIAEPFGVVAAIVPSTNPTSTAIYKILIAIKARCAIVLSPHPSAVRCISRSAEIMAPAARARRRARGQHPLDDDRHAGRHPGADEGARGGRHPGHRRDGARAGRLLGRASPPTGSVPAMRPRTSRRRRTCRRPSATSSPARPSTTECSAPLRTRSSLTRRWPTRPAQAFVKDGAYFLAGPEIDALARVLVTPSGCPTRRSSASRRMQVGGAGGDHGARPARASLIAPLAGVGRDFPLSIEKLCPVLSYYVVKDWREGCERCMQILRYGGMGHTMAIHSRERAGDPGVRPEEARVSHLRQHTDHPRVDRPDDGAGSGDDAGMRRVRRQHHLRQHHAASPAQHQAAGVRSAAGECVDAVASRSPGCSRRRPWPLPRAPQRTPAGAGQRRVAVAPHRPIPAVPRDRRHPRRPMRTCRRARAPSAPGTRARRPRSSCAKTTCASRPARTGRS